MLDSERVSQEIVVEAIMIPCPECKNDFEVVSFDPLELKKVSDEEESDEDDE